MKMSFQNITINILLLINLFFITILLGDQKLTFSANNLETINNDLENKRIFKNNVSIQKEGLYMFSNEAIHYPDSSKIYLNGNIRMYSEMDSLFCDELILYNQELQKFDARGNIIFFKNNQKMESDELKYITLDSLNNISIQLLGNVHIYDSLRVIKGDTLFLDYKDSLIKKIIVKNNAKINNSRFAKVDLESDLQIFDDIFESKKIIIVFEDDVVKYIEMGGMSNAKLYAIKDNIINGFNTLSGDSILIYLKNDSVDFLSITGGARGLFYPEKNNSDIEFNIKFNANYIDYDMKNEKSYLIDNANVQYGETLLEAGEIFADWKKNILEARIKDDIYPSVSGFSDNPTYGDLLIYDLVNKKGKIIKGETEYGTGNNKMFYNGENIFRNDNLTLHVSNSILTSCDHETPHYYFKSKKMKMIPEDHIYAKPITLFLHDYPIITLPFAIFPNKQGRRSTGWIMPSFGNNNRGTYINDLGFYYAPNDYFDNLFSLDVFDRDGLEYSSKLRYKHNSGEKWYQSLEGSLYYKQYTRFDTTKVEYKDIFKLFNEGKYIEDKDIVFSHMQKFNPLNSLSINYKRYSDSNFEKISLKEKLSQKNSTKVNYVRHFQNNAYLSVGYNYNNDMLLSPPKNSNATSTYSSTMGPNISYHIPMRDLFLNNEDKWYKRIKINYGLNYSNGAQSFTKEACIDRNRDGICEATTDEQVLGSDYDLITCSDVEPDDPAGPAGPDGLCDTCILNDNGICDNCVDDDENGICDDNYSWSSSEIFNENYGGVQNDLTFSMSSPFNLINITPTVNLYYDIVKNYDSCDDLDKDYYCDNVNTLSLDDKYIDRLSWNSAVKISADVYGIFPINIFNLNAIRHKISPVLIFTYKPIGGHSFSEVDQYYYSFEDGSIIDILNNTNARSLSTTSNNTITFNLNNEFMAKKNNINTPIHLLEYNLSTSFNNNAIQKFAPLRADLRINKTNGDKIIDIDFEYDVYDNQNNLYINKGKMPKLKTINFNMSHTFNLSGQSDQYSGILNAENEYESNDAGININMFDLDEYKPQFTNGKLWDSTIRLSADAKYENSDWTIESPNLTINGGINLTENWLLTYSGNYNFNEGKISIPTFNLSRNLHCWDFNFMWRPSGNSKGFRLKINLKNSNLQDIKVRSTSPNFKN